MTDDAAEVDPRLLAALKAFLERRAMDVDWETAKAAPASALVNSLSMALPFEPPEKQALLEAPHLPIGRGRGQLVAQQEAREPGEGDQIAAV